MGRGWGGEERGWGEGRGWEEGGWGESRGGRREDGEREEEGG